MALPSRGNESVTGLAFYVIWYDKHSANWLAALAPPIRLRRTSPCSGGRIKHLEASLRKRLCSKHGLLCPRLRGKGGGASHQRGNVFPRPSGRLYGFRRQRRYKKWRRRRRTSPAQRYYITPEGGALNPPVRRSRSQAEPLAPRAKGPAAPSTLTPVRACQPSGILESTAPIAPRARSPIPAPHPGTSSP